MRAAASVAVCAAWMVVAHDAFAQASTFARVGSIAGPVDLVEADGRFAYLAAGKTLSIVDISDPASPVRAGAYTFPGMIWGLTVSGTTIYVAADMAGLGILDVSDPRAPALRGMLKTPGQAKNVALYGTKALVADHVSGIDAIDISIPTMPKLTGSFFVDGFAKDVVIRDSFAYALDQPTGLSVFDLTKTGTFEPVSSATLANPIPLFAQLEVSPGSAKGERVVVVVGGGPLQIFTTRSGLAPVLATTHRTPGNAQRVAVRGTRAYVADGRAGLHVLDLSAPSQPLTVGTYETTMPARDVAVTESLVLVVTGSEEVLILRQEP
jgi:hypothetical protein